MLMLINPWLVTREEWVPCGGSVSSFHLGSDTESRRAASALSRGSLSPAKPARATVSLWQLYVRLGVRCAPLTVMTGSTLGLRTTSAMLKTTHNSNNNNNNNNDSAKNKKRKPKKDKYKRRWRNRKSRFHSEIKCWIAVKFVWEMDISERIYRNNFYKQNIC